MSTGRWNRLFHSTLLYRQNRSHASDRTQDDVSAKSSLVLARSYLRLAGSCDQQSSIHLAAEGLLRISVAANDGNKAMMAEDLPRNYGYLRRHHLSRLSKTMMRFFAYRG